MNTFASLMTYLFDMFIIWCKLYTLWMLLMHIPIDLVSVVESLVLYLLTVTFNWCIIICNSLSDTVNATYLPTCIILLIFLSHMCVCILVWLFCVTCEMGVQTQPFKHITWWHAVKISVEVIKLANEKCSLLQEHL